MQPYPEFIPITIDKSHIITIGERMYAESIEFVRELVNNAYDADATLVEIVVTEDKIEIRDNGSGMDWKGSDNILILGHNKNSMHQSPPYTKGTGLDNSELANLQVFLLANALRSSLRKMTLLVGLSLIRNNGRW